MSYLSIQFQSATCNNNAYAICTQALVQNKNGAYICSPTNLQMHSTAKNPDQNSKVKKITHYFMTLLLLELKDDKDRMGVTDQDLYGYKLKCRSIISI